MLNLDRIIAPALPVVTRPQAFQMSPNAFWYAVVFDPDTAPEDYMPMLSAIKTAGYYVFGSLVDSAAESQFSPRRRRGRTKLWLTALRGLVDVWEAGNEVNGDWLGNDVEEKVKQCVTDIQTEGQTAAVTWYWPGSLGILTKSLSTVSYAPHLAMLSYYPADEGKAPFDDVFSAIGKANPTALALGFREYGAEWTDGNGKTQQGTQAEKIAIVQQVETAIVSEPRYQKGGGYWDAALDVVLSDLLMPTFQTISGWKK